MSRGEGILGRHRAAIRALAHQHNIASVALVDSVSRGTDRPDSDCDFLCRFAPGTTLIDLAGLEIALEEMLGCPVQLSSERMLEEPYTSMLDDAIALSHAKLSRTPVGRQSTPA